MVRSVFSVFGVIGLIFLSGCTSHISPIVRNVRTLPDGSIHVERCELTQQNVFSWSVDVDDCKWSKLTAGTP